MNVYRIARSIYAEDLSGTGARMVGGRWNSKGIALLYTAESRALAAMELAVRVNFSRKPKDLVMITIAISKDAKIIVPDTLPEDWHQFPHRALTRQIGDNFVLEGKALILKVPSAVVKGDYNYLINPLHLSFKNIRILHTTSFDFDERLGR
jgi:RES domain-containing protein